MHATTEGMFGDVLSTRSVPKCYKQDELVESLKRELLQMKHKDNFGIQRTGKVRRLKRLPEAWK